MLPDRSGTLYLTDLDAGIHAFCIRYGRRGFDWRLRMRASPDRSLQSRSISRLDMRRGDPPPPAPPTFAARTRIVSAAGIRLDHRKSVRSFKGIFCHDISEFESYMPSQPVRSH